MQKQFYRKLLSTLIAGLLVLSVVSAIIPTSAAPTATLMKEFWPVPVPAPDGNVGDEIYVNGTIDTVGGGVDVYWENLGNRIAGDYANGTGHYNISITIPEDIHATYIVIVVDNSTNLQATASFTILSKITVDPKVGLPDDEVTIEGTGFGSQKIVIIHFHGPYATIEVGDAETDAKGSFSAAFHVPSFPYSDYWVNATDEDGNFAVAAFEIGATIALNPEEGPSGTVVTITGQGFTAHRDITVAVSDTGWSITASQVADIETKYDGTFEGEFVVPTVPFVDEDEGYTEYTVKATDEDGVSSTLDFKVTGNSSITLTPETGSPGSEVTIEGVNFTAIEGVEVTVKFGTIEVESQFTNVTGGFEGPITVPGTVGMSTVNATDEFGLWATASFTIVITDTVAYPGEGPVGTNVILITYGLTGTTANVTLGDILVLENEPVADLAAGNSWFLVPTVPVDNYTLTAEDDDGLSTSTNFEVTATTTLTLDPSAAPVGYNVTITGENFAPDSTVSLVLYNSTYELEMENVTWQWGVPYGKTEIQTDEDGVFEFEWNVSAFAGEILDLGSYCINATDDYDVYPDNAKLIYINEVPFEVVEPTFEVYTGASEYMRGQYAQFFAKSSFETTVAIEITDPTDFVHAIDIETTTKVGTLYLGTATVSIANDAATGTWTWIAEAFDKNATGSFDVVEEITVKLTGEFDYLLGEPVRIRLAALVRDTNTMETVSGANVTIQIYDVKGNHASLAMVERIAGSGIYEWISSGTIEKMEVKKGVYLVRAQASYKGATGIDILLFHIDPPTEGTHEVLLQMVFAAVASAVVTALILKRGRIAQRIRQLDRHN